MQRIVHVESSYNPFAIGVVGGALQRQPNSLDEAVSTANALEQAGYNYSVGLSQVNKKNFSRYGLTLRTAFDPCENLRAGSRILADCFERAPGSRDDQAALRAAMSCYYSGNFLTGFSHGYVAKIVSVEPPSEAQIRVPRLIVTDAERAARGAVSQPVSVRAPAPANRKSGRSSTAAPDAMPTAEANASRSALLF